MVTVIVAFAVGTGIVAWLTIALCNCDLTNWQSLLFEGVIFAGGLGSLFYYFQARGSKKIEDAVNKIEHYTESVKYYQESSKRKSLRHVSTYLESDRNMIEVILLSVEKKANESTAGQIVEFKSWQKFFSSPNFRKIKKEEINNLRSLPFDVDKYGVINSAVNYVDMLAEDYEKVNDAESLENWLAIAEVAMQTITSAIQVISKESAESDRKSF